MNKIHLLVADDHPIVRRGLIDLLSTTLDIEVVGEASDGDMAIEMGKLLKPDVLLLDMVMPKKDGVEVIREFHTKLPQVRILVLTSFSDDEKVFSAIKSGALGYILKDSSPEELLQAIRNVSRGVSSLHPHIALKVIGELRKPTETAEMLGEALTQREEEVLELLADGMSNQEIADKLCISPKTTGKHVSNILGKLHLANRTQAALYAMQQRKSQNTPNK
jgi:NarL family two-component system response regulator LiaR